MSTDEFEVDEDGYAYDPHRDYYSNFEEEQQEQGNEEDFKNHSQYGHIMSWLESWIIMKKKLARFINTQFLTSTQTRFVQAHDTVL